MKGKLYGIGVGPGDPGLLTLRAKEILEKAHVIAYPVGKAGGEGTALDIVKQAVDISGKEVAELVFKMDPDDGVRRKCRAENIGRICQMLDRGDDIAMITLGDVAVYSTYMYLDREVRERGYDTEVVPGIPSFCHGAAKAGLPLMIGEESLAVFSMAKHNIGKIEEALGCLDNIVIMKAFASMGEIAEMMARNGIPLSAASVMSNIGMDDEYVGPLDADRKYGYFTTVLIKKGGI